jgi:glycosyltransferase involved in cell wall biosynthesis
MHLALVIYGSLDTVSGGYLYDRMLVQYLREQGDEVEIVSLPWRNYAVHLTQNFAPQLRNWQGYDAVLQDELNHPSLFIANRIIKGSPGFSRDQFRAPANQVGASRAWTPKIRIPPVISIVHHLRASEQRPAWQNAFYRLIERWYLASVDGFVFNSHTTQKAVEALVGGGRPSVVAYPAGSRFGEAISVEAIRERATHPSPLKLLFVGNVIPRKGLHTLLDALKQIEEGWELNVIGSLATDPAYAAEMQRRAPLHVNFLGSVSDEQITNYYLQSHCLIVPSSYEGFGIVYLEGMGFGLPAIASAEGGASEIITPGRDGFLVKPGDSPALAAHIRTLIQDRELLLKLSLAARERFLQHPTWAQSMESVRQFLQKAARS